MKLKVLFECLKLQNKQKYFEYVRNFNYKDALKEDALSIRDKFNNEEELSETTINKITSFIEMHQEILKKYKLNEIATAENDFEKTLQILNWLTNNTYYNGAQIRLVEDNTLKILAFSLKKSFKYAINCRLKAIAFADCLVSIGIKAYPVCMISTRFYHCHFTCHAYISELDKWCVFDPSFGCWFTDTEGNLIDVFEMRELFLQDKEPVVNGYSFNGTTECFDVYVNSFLKICMSNLMTWNNNSMNRRTTKILSNKKEFKSKIPN